MNLLTPQDLPGKLEYEESRADLRRRLMARKERRRVAVGDPCTVHFENRETVRYQVLEMLRAEDSWSRPGAVEGELAAYNPLNNPRFPRIASGGDTRLDSSSPRRGASPVS